MKPHILSLKEIRVITHLFMGQKTNSILNIAANDTCSLLEIETDSLENLLSLAQFWQYKTGCKTFQRMTLQKTYVLQLDFRCQE